MLISVSVLVFCKGVGEGEFKEALLLKGTNQVPKGDCSYLGKR